MKNGLIMPFLPVFHALMNSTYQTDEIKLRLSSKGFYVRHAQ